MTGQRNNSQRCWLRGIACTITACAALACVSTVRAQSESLARGVSGLLEPYQTVSLSSSESGVILDIAVTEGQQVRRGDEIASLESDLQKTQLGIARQRMESLGELQVARAEWEMRRQRLEKLLKIQSEGHARMEEVDRARTDLEMAIARFTSQQDELAIRKLEHIRARQTLDRRTIRSPIDGLVSRVERKVGEFISPVRPEVAVIIQSDPILAVFPVPIHEVDSLNIGDDVSVTLDRHVTGPRTDSSRRPGRIESIGVTIDSASQTVQVKVRLQNPDYLLRVGEPCKLWKSKPMSSRNADTKKQPAPRPQERPTASFAPPRPHKRPAASFAPPEPAGPAVVEPTPPHGSAPKSAPAYPQEFAPPPTDFPTP